MSPRAHLSKYSGLVRAGNHECLLWLAWEISFYLHESIPESEVVPASSAGFRIPSVRCSFRIQHLQSQQASLRGSGLLAGGEEMYFSGTCARSFNDQKALVSVMGLILRPLRLVKESEGEEGKIQHSEQFGSNMRSQLILLLRTSQASIK